MVWSLGLGCVPTYDDVLGFGAVRGSATALDLVEAHCELVTYFESGYSDTKLRFNYTL